LNNSKNFRRNRWGRGRSQNRALLVLQPAMGTGPTLSNGPPVPPSRYSAVAPGASVPLWVPASPSPATGENFGGPPWDSSWGLWIGGILEGKNPPLKDTIIQLNLGSGHNLRMYYNTGTLTFFDNSNDQFLIGSISVISHGSPSQEIVGTPWYIYIASTGRNGVTVSTKYNFLATYVNAIGETIAGVLEITTTMLNSVLSLEVPSELNATAANYYIIIGGVPYLQNSAPIPIGTAWNMPISGPVTGTASPPLISTAAQLLPNTPAAPTVGTVAGGVIVAQTYYYSIQYFNAAGTTLPSAQGSLAAAADELLTIVNSAGDHNAINATAWAPFVGLASGALTQQGPVGGYAMGTTWTEPTTGLTITGSAPATANTAGILLPQPPQTTDFAFVSVGTISVSFYLGDPSIPANNIGFLNYTVGISADYSLIDMVLGSNLNFAPTYVIWPLPSAGSPLSLETNPNIPATKLSMISVSPNPWPPGPPIPPTPGNGNSFWAYAQSCDIVDPPIEVGTVILPTISYGSYGSEINTDLTGWGYFQNNGWSIIGNYVPGITCSGDSWSGSVGINFITPNIQTFQINSSNSIPNISGYPKGILTGNAFYLGTQFGIPLNITWKIEF